MDRSFTLFHMTSSRISPTSVRLVTCVVFCTFVSVYVTLVVKLWRSGDVGDDVTSSTSCIGRQAGSGPATGKTAARKLASKWRRGLNSSAPCSTSLFRRHYVERGYFPGEGKWESELETRIVTNNSETRNVTLRRRRRFVPEICKFRHDGTRSLPVEKIHRCFRLRNVTSVATMGDSNAAHHYDSLLDVFGGCEKTAAEVVDHTLLMPDVNYYGRFDRQLLTLLRATHRHCSSCVSRTHRCSAGGGGGGRSPGQTGRDEGRWWVETEHLSMVSVLDSTVKIDVPHNHFAVNLQYRADTYQELVLKYYLRGRYPDLLIIFPPFNHDKKSETSSSLALRLQYFVSLLELYLPSTTQIFWIPSFREFESRKPPVWANRRMHGLLGTQKLEQFNRVLYRILESRLTNPDSRTHGFFDQLRVSEDLEDWSVDGVHMASDWYDKMAAYILQTFCGDVIDK